MQISVYSVFLTVSTAAMVIIVKPSKYRNVLIFFCDQHQQRQQHKVFLFVYFQTNVTEKNVSDDVLRAKIKPSIRLIKSILQTYFYNNCAYEQEPPQMFRVFRNDNQLQDVIETYLLFSIGERLWYKLAEIAVFIHFIAVHVDSKDGTLDDEEMMPHLKAAFGVLEKAIAKKHVKNVNLLTVLLIENYCRLRTRSSLPLPNRPIKDPTKFAGQIITMQLVPISLFAKKQFGISWDFLMMTDSPPRNIQQFDQYTNKVAAEYRELLNETEFTPDLPLDAIYNIECSVRQYQGATLMAMFQMLAYFFHDFCKCLRASETQKEIALRDYSRFYASMVQVLRDIIRQRQFNSADCDNTVCLMSAAVDFLQAPWPERVRKKNTF